MLTGLMRKLVEECSDDDLDALTELIRAERERRWQQTRPRSWVEEIRDSLQRPKE